MNDTLTCPPTRTGHETLHTCGTPDTCQVPAWWEDHCHAYLWLLDMQAGDEAALTQLIRYYRPVLVEVASKRFATFDWNDVYAYGLEVMWDQLSKYNTDLHVPMQAYLRKYVPLRIIDRLRSDKTLVRNATSFQQDLETLRTEFGHLSDGQLARKLIGTPRGDDPSRVYTEEVVLNHLARVNGSSPLHLQNPGLTDETVGLDVADPDTVEDLVARQDEVATAKAVTEQLLEGMSDHDRELLMTYFEGRESLNAWAKAHGYTGVQADAAAQKLREQVRVRAEVMLNVAPHALLMRRYDQAAEKMLLGLRTGRLVPADAPTVTMPARRSSRPRKADEAA